MALTPTDQLIAQQKETNKLLLETNKLLGKAIDALVTVDKALGRIGATTERFLTREGTAPPDGA